MLARLAKLSQVSAQLRSAHLTKEAIVGLVAKAALKNPLTAMSAYSNIKGGVGQYRQNQAGFQPEVHQQQLAANQRT